MIAKVLLLLAEASDTESVKNSGWKGSPWVIWENYLLQVRPAEVTFVQGFIQSISGYLQGGRSCRLSCHQFQCYITLPVKKKKILITSNNFPHCVWCLLFCPVIVFLLELGFNFIHTVFSLAATKSPDILHSQTKTSPSKTFSEDGQVHPCHHPHSRFAVFLHPSLEPLHCLDQ